ncbi:MAG TPA: hypothetical protein VHF27_14040 [Acidimicrobiales bacterium]|nr:hypothetical protein [Acidimicrobiales bacterium]
MSWQPEEHRRPDAGACRAAAAIVVPAAGRADAFVVTNPRRGLFEARNLAHFSFADGDWGEAIHIDAGRLRDVAPTAVAMGPDRIEVAAIGADEDDGRPLLYRREGTGSWSGPERLPTARLPLSRAAPVLVDTNDGRLHLIGVSDTDGPVGPRKLLHWTRTGSIWATPVETDARLMDFPIAAVSRAVGLLDVFAVGADDLDRRVLRFTMPSPGAPLGSGVPLTGLDRVTHGGVAALAFPRGDIAVVAVRGDGAILRWRYDAQRNRWGDPPLHALLAPRLDGAGRPWVVRHPDTGVLEIFGVQDPLSAAGPRQLSHWIEGSNRLLPQERRMEWLNAFGPVAAFSGTDLHVVAVRDDGGLTFGRREERPVFRNFAGNLVLPVTGFADPASLPELRHIVRSAEERRLPVHAVGRAWAFSAPAHCDGIVVRTDRLNKFPRGVQSAVVQPGGEHSLLVAVEAGISIRNLYTALDLERRFDGGQNPDPALLRHHAWTLPSLGGAGHQTIAGAISTGTHGGDAARTPLSGAVRAMLIVGSGGVLRLLQRRPAAGTRPVVDVARLQDALRAEHRDPSLVIADPAPNDELFEAALVSVGRFGVVYAYVLEVLDEHRQVVVERREKSTWEAEREGLLRAAQDARRDDHFLQVAINSVPQPMPDNTRKRVCYVTTHTVADAPPPDSTEIRVARASGGGAFEQLLCATSLTPELRLLMTAAEAGALIGVARTGALVDALRRIGGEHKLADAVSAVLNDATRAGDWSAVAVLQTAMLDGAQREWVVHGRRHEIADFYDYNNDCYRGDSVELFFDAERDLPGAVDDVLGVFDGMRAGRIAVGAYIAVRFMAKDPAVLGPAAFPLTFSVEVAMLRGLLGNTEALRRLQAIAIRRRGRVHWGQQNDLTAGQVATLFGLRALRAFQTQLAAVEGVSPTFSNAFARARGLEPRGPADWSQWRTMGLQTSGNPAVASAGADQPLEVFALGTDRAIRSSRRLPATTGPAPWLTVDTRPVDGTPVVIRNPDGRLELFVLDQERIIHRDQMHRPGGEWSGWDMLSGPVAEVASADPAVAAHRDGRLELVARGVFRERFRLFHAWAQWVNGPWTGFRVHGEPGLATPPALAARISTDRSKDQLFAVATAPDGAVIEKHQEGPLGDSPWTSWRQLRRRRAFRAAGPVLLVPDTTGPEPRLRALAVDAAGVPYEAVESGTPPAVAWSDWTALPRLGSLGDLDPSLRLTAIGSASRVEVFAVTRMGLVVTCTRRSERWSEWTSLGGEVAGPVAAGVHASGQIEVVVRNALNDELMSRVQTSPGQW